jgi:hypothetical protein
MGAKQILIYDYQELNTLLNLQLINKYLRNQYFGENFGVFFFHHYSGNLNYFSLLKKLIFLHTF